MKARGFLKENVLELGMVFRECEGERVKDAECVINGRVSSTGLATTCGSGKTVWDWECGITNVTGVP